MKINLCCYSTEEYEDRKNRLVNLSIAEGFDKTYSYGRGDILKTDFYRENKLILDMKRGGGYWLWKPYFILDTLKNITEGDVVFYLDSGDVFGSGTKNYLMRYFESNDIMISSGYTLNKIWTKRDCFYYMNCENEKFWNAVQVEAGILAFKKTINSINFLNEWLMYCQIPSIITDSENTCGLNNFENFIDHRHDQSILTNLCVKHNIIANMEIRNYVKCNV